MNVLATESSETTRPDRRLLSKARTCGKVLAGAATLFREHPYEEVTIRGVADRIGMSTGAVFGNFLNKEDLFAAVLAADLEESEEGLLAAIKIEGSAEEILTALFAADRERQMLQLGLLRSTFSLWWSGVPEVAKYMLDLQVRMESLAQQVLKDAVGRGELSATFPIAHATELLWYEYLSQYNRMLSGSTSGEKFRQRFQEAARFILARCAAK